jgi:hypothetical protein
VVKENARAVRPGLFKHLPPLIGASKSSALLTRLTILNWRKRIAPDKRHTSRTKLRRGQRSKSHAANRKRLSSYEHEKELLTILEAISPKCMQKLSVNLVEGILQCSAEEIILLITSLRTLPIKVIKYILPIHILASLCI